MLPDKPSDLIELALSDLEKCEKDDGTYQIEMGEWHTSPDSSDSGMCEVCLAGAVMAQSLHVTPQKCYRPEYFDLRTNRKLRMLDLFRQGQVLLALDEGGIKIPRHVGDKEMRRYRKDRKGFKADMRAMASQLREAGL